MRIWFDLSNSPHINLFEGLIRELGLDHEIVITCRPLANTIELLDLHGLPYTVVGQHYGKGLLPKVFGYPVRVAALRSFLANRSIDVAVSQSSFHSPLVGRLLGARSVYTNDNEHALGNVPAFLFANVVLVPEYLSLDRVRRQGASRRKIVTYPGVKEGIYLWRLAAEIGERIGRRSARSRPTVYVRPEPRTAQYYRGGENFLDATLVELKTRARVVVLPRDRAQVAHYADAKFEGIDVASAVAELKAIAPDCDLFVGAGGTMTREMAVLGIPTISVYRGELLDVDRHLIALGRMAHHPELSAAQAFSILDASRTVPPSDELLVKGKAAYELFKQVILDATA
jgi:predicted glycosyltransferase